MIECTLRALRGTVPDSRSDGKDTEVEGIHDLPMVRERFCACR